MMRTVEVMQDTVIAVGPELPLQKLEDFLTGADIGGVPVVAHDGKILGVVSKTDLVRSMSNEEGQQRDPLGPEPTVEDIMTHEVVAANPDDDIRDVARQMIDGHLHRVLIVDDEEVVGIVTTLDLLRAFLFLDATNRQRLDLQREREGVHQN